MPELLERARAYLDALEVDRLAALAASEQAAAEAKLLQARLEGFQAALKMFGRHSPDGEIGVSDDTRIPPAKEDTEPVRTRRTRRNIPELVTRELSFSGQPMTARQIANAIEYTLERTETALSRMEKHGQVHRDEGERWAIGALSSTPVNGHAARAGNGAYRKPSDE